MLCIELIGFAIGHWTSFSYYPFTISQLPYGRFQFKYALKDCLGFKDLLSDFKLTFHGDHYKDYKLFYSVEANVAHPDSKGRMSRIHQGLRYHYDGKHKHWLPDNQSITSNTNIIPSTSEIHALDNSSIYSGNTSSMKGIYPNSPKTSPPNSPKLPGNSMYDLLINDSELNNIDYSNEDFENDEEFYKESIRIINNYGLEDNQIKKLLNYPIVDEVIDSHVYGYKVQKLRQRQLLRQVNRSRQEEQSESFLQSNESYRYGSIV